MHQPSAGGHRAAADPSSAPADSRVTEGCRTLPTLRAADVTTLRNDLAAAQAELRRLRSEAAAARQRIETLEASCRQLSVNQFADVQALARLGTWEWDFVSGRLAWSTEVKRLFGLLPEDAIHNLNPAEVKELLHPDDLAPLRELAAGLRASGERRGYRFRMIARDGSVRHTVGWAESEIDPVTGRCARAWGTVQDVTEAVTREAALAESEQRLRLTIENSPIGVALVGLDGEWLQVNEAMARMVGYDPDSLMKLRFQDITHPDDLDADLTLLEELRAGKRDCYQLDKRYLHSSGRVVWAHLTASVVRDADGRPLHYVSLVKDITDSHKAAAELQAERDLSAALLGALHDGYAYLERGRVVAVNDVFCEMTGLSREALLGKPTPFTLFAGDKNSPPAALRKMLNDRSGHVELAVERPDGSRLDVGIQLRPVRRPDGRVRGYVALMRDITDRKQHEQRLRHRADHDGLTGLLNRAAFHVRLTERVAAAQASGAPLSLALIDLDRFKLVNDLHGHPTGDAVLAAFADRLRGNARGDDVIGRLGGEEFGWLMSDAGRAEALGALTRTLDAVRRHPFPHGEQLTFSAGLVQLRTLSVGGSAAIECETSGALLQRADELMYAAKARGRDQIVSASDPASRPAGRRA